MRSHLQDFAHGLLAKHGPRTAGMILHGFTNLGNVVPGATPAEQLAFVETELNADDRIAEPGENPGRGGGWYSHKENHDDAGGE